MSVRLTFRTGHGVPADLLPGYESSPQVTAQQQPADYPCVPVDRNTSIGTVPANRGFVGRLMNEFLATGNLHFKAEVTDERAFTSVNGHQRNEAGELESPPARGVGLHPTPTSHPSFPPARPKGTPHPFGLVHSLQ